MRIRHNRARARRGGTEALEFALIFPLFLVMVFGIIDYSWYFYQRAAVADAARKGCLAAATMSLVMDDYVDAARTTVEQRLQSSIGVSCSGGVGCTIGLADRSMVSPPRIICDVSIDFRSLTGFFGDPMGASPTSGVGRLAGWTEGNYYIPKYVRARASAIFEEAK